CPGRQKRYSSGQVNFASRDQILHSAPQARPGISGPTLACPPPLVTGKATGNAIVAAKATQGPPRPPPPPAPCPRRADSPVPLTSALVAQPHAPAVRAREPRVTRIRAAMVPLSARTSRTYTFAHSQTMVPCRSYRLRVRGRTDR